MNYRHAYHAGNFADVLKHAVLARLVEYLKNKEKPFRVIDTHAGRGLYDLSSPEAQKTGEWLKGIGLLLDAKIPPKVGEILEPYLEAVRGVNSGGGLARYPGSPMIVRQMMRKQDRLSAIELHPQDFQALYKRFSGDFQVRVTELDGWLALGAHLPPKEKRGLVLIDPPFEEEGEFERLADGLAKAYRRWPGGTYAIWYPIKDLRAVNAFRKALSLSEIPKIIDIVLETSDFGAEPRLVGSGMIVVNPPFTLEAELRTILPFLHETLAEKKQGRWSVDRLTGEV